MRKLGVVMDPISKIKIAYDTTFALMLEAQARDWEIYYLEAQDIWLQEGIVWGRMQQLELKDDPNSWFEVQQELVQPLSEMNCILMRKDPPFNMEYIYLTYLLEQVEAHDVLVINRPSSLRDANEKLFTTWFPQCCPKTLVSSDREVILEFVEDNENCIIKPLDSMGGNSIFKLERRDPNLNSIIDLVTHKAHRHVMVQEFLPDISKGDKRIFLVNGEASLAFARIPAIDDFRGNLSAGAHAEIIELSERDHWIIEQLNPVLKDKGLIFVGIDIIGDYLTEINVTSPGCAREIEAASDFNACAKLFDYIENELQ
ncbi:MAG TPA: glutathione synthase [Coxiellaceae bacterium]|nr:glutathione synthase [Coxiellaceae bacterium]